MFDNIPLQDKIDICDEQLRQVYRQIFSQMIELGLDPASVDPSTVAVDDNGTQFEQDVQSELVSALSRATFIEEVKSALEA